MEVWLVVEPGFRLGAAHFSTSTFPTPLSAGQVLSHRGRDGPSSCPGTLEGGSCLGPGLFSKPGQHIRWIKFSSEGLPPEPGRPLLSRPDCSKSQASWGIWAQASEPVRPGRSS